MKTETELELVGNFSEALEEVKRGIEQIRFTLDGSQPIDTIGAVMALDTLVARIEIALLPSLDVQLDEMIPQWTKLVIDLLSDIEDDYRASEEDTEPSMQLTIGFTPATPENDASWSYQTGDNSFTGGAYGHPHWGVASLYRDSIGEEVAEEIASQIG